MSVLADRASGAGVLDRLQVLRSAPTPLRGAPAATWPPSPRTGVRQLRVAGPGLQPWLQDTTTTRTDPAGSTLATPVLGPRNGVHLLQGPLIASILELLREASQLWIATHSIGVVREAHKMLLDRPGEVVFLDFSGMDFDGPVTIKPSAPTRVFWKNMYEVALDDLSSLVAPHRVVICEGSKDKHVEAFDARCYNRLFADEFSETLFISRGGSGEVIQSEHLVAILKSIARGIDVQKLIDRDDMTGEVRSQQIAQGISVLRRRELEEYLYDSEVLRTFLREMNVDEAVAEKVLSDREALVNGQPGPTNIKDVSQQIFAAIRGATGLPNLGNNRDEFAVQFLVPALRKTPVVYKELREAVFSSPRLTPTVGDEVAVL